MMLRVSIESPYAATSLEQRIRYINYAHRAFWHSIARDEAPFISHLFYTGLLDDNIKTARELGLSISDQWRKSAHLLAFYVDFGISPGMQRAKDLAAKHGLNTVFRTIGQEPTQI